MRELKPVSALRRERAEAMVQTGLVAILRFSRPVELVKIAQALVAGGVTALEITLTTPGALQAISELRNVLPNAILVGAGTILDASDVARAAFAGAEFIVTPTLQPESITSANGLDLPIACGAFTPTEALAAHQLGADFVKLFPAEVFGVKGIKAMLAPLPFLQIIPTGGVNLENVHEFLEIGCPAVAVGTGLMPSKFIEDERWDGISELAREYINAASRSRKSPTFPF